MSAWMDDARDIRGAKLANGEWYQWITGDRFERIEQPGEYCMLPWLRITTWKGGHVRVIEAPLTQTEFVEYAPAQAGEAQRAETTEIGAVHEHAVPARNAPK